MSSINKVILIGHVGQDPLVHRFKDGGAISKFSIAVNKEWKDKVTGEKKKKTTWISVKAQWKGAELVEQYLKKGDQVYVEGSLERDEYVTKDGEAKNVTYVVMDRFWILKSKSKEGGMPEDSEEERVLDYSDSDAIPASSHPSYDQVAQRPSRRKLSGGPKYPSPPPDAPLPSGTPSFEDEIPW